MSTLTAGQSGIPRPKSTYTLPNRPSVAVALTPSRRINSGIPEPQPRSYTAKAGSTKVKTALNTPAVRPRPSHALVPLPALTSSTTRPANLTTPAPAHGGLHQQTSRPALRKAASRPSLGKPERIFSSDAADRQGNTTHLEAASLGRKSGPRLSGGGLVRKASRPGLRKVASRPSLVKAERVPVSAIPTTPAIPTPTRLRGPTSVRAVGSVAQLRPVGSLKGAHSTNARDQLDVPAVPAIPARHLRQAAAPQSASAGHAIAPTRVVPKPEIRAPLLNVPNAPNKTSSEAKSTAAEPTAIPLPPTPLHNASPVLPKPSIQTPFMPRIKRLSMTRPWDSPVSYSPLNNVQLSFDADLDSDSEVEDALKQSLSGLGHMPANRMPARLARQAVPGAIAVSRFDRQSKAQSSPIDAQKVKEQERRIAELEARIAEQQRDLEKAQEERDEIARAGREADKAALNAQAAWKRGQAQSVQQQFDTAIEQGTSMRADMVAQLDLIRSLRRAYTPMPA